MTDSISIPREGMMATVRNRRALVTRVKPFSTKTGNLHLVDVEYTDVDGGKAEERLLWEREVGARLTEPSALPGVHSESPMPPRDFDALVRASRWAALTPFLAADGSGQLAELPIASPFHGAVQVEDFQLVPLLAALRMPRVSLLLADDVGLGKTIEAGLILTELLLRRRIRRVLIMTPAALRDQWQQEMADKFSLSFDVVDRPQTHQLRKRLGLDANPWRTQPRIITSYHYLRQPDVLQQFLAAAPRREGSPTLPWDLLIVDEAHNLMPPPFGEHSDLTRMLAAISPLFEHKLFLTATPHNGHTRSFSGLLSLLDPVRFVQTSEFSPSERKRVEQVVVRRLKREINAIDLGAGRQPRFPKRNLEPLQLQFSRKERALADAFARLREAIVQANKSRGSGNQLAGSFALEVLSKRLLSCPRTFADSWYRVLDGTREPEPADADELLAARRASEEDLVDDLEKQGRDHHASRTAGAWLKPLLVDVQREVAAVTAALVGLGTKLEGDRPTVPKFDARFDRLVALIDQRLRNGKFWVDDERLIVFTEYKTTLDDLWARLREYYADEAGERVRVLYGGLDMAERQTIKDAFNDALDPVRILLATDAASEGLNLQETARLLLHYEIPWNPARLEQRNGRLDRHGQACDVTIFHFTSEDDADLAFLERVIAKVEQIREDLGSLGEIFDRAFERRFTDLEDAEAVASDLDQTIERRREVADLPSVRATGLLADDRARVAQLRVDIDLNSDTLRDTLEVALGLEIGQPRLRGPDSRGRFELLDSSPRWKAVVDDDLRLPNTGAIPRLVFSPDAFIEERLGRPVFRPRKDTVLLHLGHSMFRHALANFARLRFPGADDRLSASRWMVRRGPVPAGADALISLTVEEMAVNELREAFHHWVRTLRLPVSGERLGPPLPYMSPNEDRGGRANPSKADVAAARELWGVVEGDVRDALLAHEKSIESRIVRGVASESKHVLGRARKLSESRIREVEKALESQSMDKLEREIEAERKRTQLFLYGPDQREADRRLASKQEELARRKEQYRGHLEFLRREEKRTLEDYLPKRFTIREGGVRVFPLTVEIRLPEVRS
ncbi:DISARM system SNF2-like helicase DrmD [Nannocystaceae bacterium ST9]